jgi:hypothetical protein
MNDTTAADAGTERLGTFADRRVRAHAGMRSAHLSLAVDQREALLKNASLHASAKLADRIGPTTCTNSTMVRRRLHGGRRRRRSVLLSVAPFSRSEQAFPISRRHHRSRRIRDSGRAVRELVERA